MNEPHMSDEELVRIIAETIMRSAFELTTDRIGVHRAKAVLVTLREAGADL